MDLSRLIDRIGMSTNCVPKQSAPIIVGIVSIEHLRLATGKTVCRRSLRYLMRIPVLSADYYDTPYYTEYECSFPLLDHAVLTATSALRERGPQNARLNGKCTHSALCTHTIIHTHTHTLRARTRWPRFTHEHVRIHAVSPKCVLEM